MVRYTQLEDGQAAYRQGDYATAVKLWRPLAEHGDLGARFRLGLACYSGHGVPQDYTMAATWFRKAAEEGFARAQYNLGVIYATGRGVPQDYAMAATWYRKAADAGVANAQHDLGANYENGRGVPRDYAMAATWYRKAARRRLRQRPARSWSHVRERPRRAAGLRHGGDMVSQGRRRRRRSRPT
jgi:TPR repeat protein